jgi:hypothetical protein
LLTAEHSNSHILAPLSHTTMGSAQETTQDRNPTYDLADEKQQLQLHHFETTVDTIPHSLALLPAGLELAVPFSPNDKEVYIEEKQPVQAGKETLHQIRTESVAAAAEKELFETLEERGDTLSIEGSRAAPKRICGIRAKVFWISLVCAVVVFCLGVGIGMGTSKLKRTSDG